MTFEDHANSNRGAMRSGGRLNSFAKSEDGTIAVLMGISLVAFIAFAGLVFDIGRFSATHTDLQSYADHVALAAAGELDGQADAFERAERAASELVAHTVVFTQGDGILSGELDYELTFYEAIPDDDSVPLPSTGFQPLEEVVANARFAYFARVVVTPRSVSFPFTTAARRLLTGATEALNPRVSAEAVAGFTTDACDISPLMFCLPPGKYSAEPEDPGNILGDMILLRSGGNGGAWAPGNFGFLDLTKVDTGSTCKNKSGGPLLACMIAAERGARQCFPSNGVITETGQKEGITSPAFNVRFDLYEKSMNKGDYPAAPNVLKGIVAKNGNSACIKGNEAASSDTIGMPRDDCFGNNSCRLGRFGNGAWDAGRDEYYFKNFDIAAAPEDPDDPDEEPVKMSGSTMTDFVEYARQRAIDAGALRPYEKPAVVGPLEGSRWEQYLAEIALAEATGGAITPPGRSETGLPSCNTAKAETGAHRRVVIAAGVRCGTGPGEYDIRGKTTGVRPEAYYEVFLTEPVGSDASSPPNFDIWGEVIGSAGGNGLSASGFGGVFRDIVQLYR